MALSGFEIAIGGITSIPVVGGLIFLGYKSFGESSLDASKLKSKQKPAAKKETPASDKKELKEKIQKQESKDNSSITTTIKVPQSKPRKPEVKQDNPTADKKEKSLKQESEDNPTNTTARKTSQGEPQ